jgi:hypothetical protein
MKITKTASGTKKITLSKSEWQSMGKQAGWDKSAKIHPDWTKPEDDYTRGKRDCSESKEEKSGQSERYYEGYAYIQDIIDERNARNSAMAAAGISDDIN